MSHNSTANFTHMRVLYIIRGWPLVDYLIIWFLFENEQYICKQFRTASLHPSLCCVWVYGFLLMNAVLHYVIWACVTVYCELALKLSREGLVPDDPLWLNSLDLSASGSDVGLSLCVCFLLCCAALSVLTLSVLTLF